MSPTDIKYVLDANVFIEAYRRYYSFDIAPAFWKFIIESVNSEKILSIDRVYDELQCGKDELADWIKSNISHAFIELTNDEQTLRNYAEIMSWSANQTQFSQNAINEFARVENADAWLISYAITNNFVVVTHEVFKSNIRNKIPIPNVCEAFNVKYIDTFKLLRALDFKFN